MHGKIQRKMSSKGLRRGVDAPRAEALMAAVRAAGTPVLLAAHERHTLSLADTVVYLDGPPLKVLQIRGKPLQ